MDCRTIEAAGVGGLVAITTFRPSGPAVLKLRTRCVRVRIGFACLHAREDEGEARLTRWSQSLDLPRRIMRDIHRGIAARAS